MLDYLIRVITGSGAARYQAGAGDSDSMYVAKVAVAEQAGTLLFQAEFYCDTVAYLYNNSRFFMDLLMEASERHRLVYERLRLESEKRSRVSFLRLSRKEPRTTRASIKAYVL